MQGLVIFCLSTKKKVFDAAKELGYQEESIICGIVRNIAREEESMNILTLKELRNTEVDMFSTVYIGNKMTKIIKDKMVTPRGYRYDRK